MFFDKFCFFYIVWCGYISTAGHVKLSLSQNGDMTPTSDIPLVLQNKLANANIKCKILLYQFSFLANKMKSKFNQSKLHFCQGRHYLSKGKSGLPGERERESPEMHQPISLI